MSINIDKELLETALGFSDEEEWMYKLMCAITDCDNINYWEAGASLTAPEKIYAFGADYWDPVAGSYVGPYLNLPAHSIYNFALPNVVVLDTGEKAYVANATGYGGMYVKDSDVTAVTDARATWHKRAKYLTNTVPTRYKVPHTAANETINTTITVTTRALIGHVGYVSILGADIMLYDTVNYRNMYAMAGADYSGAGPTLDYGYHTRKPLVPLRPIGGKTWVIRSFSSAYFSAGVCNLYFEVYDNLPSPPW